ncbi:hypothetical protein GCM10027052_26420 [Parafrigoribacterium mesophilum]|uniref:nuclear transport factor 2 family protein n=1 Tax=Parafrigoribacterium mesophilum TaxID=433646 RepID=UPI0031FD0C3D
MTELERLLIKQACTELVTRAHIFVDRFQHDELVACFADDAVFENAVVGGALRGRDEIKAYYDRKNTRILAQHITTNIVIEVIDETHATGISYFTFYFAGEGFTVPSTFAGPTAVGQYEDVFVLVGDAWKFASRTMTNRFQVGLLSDLALVDSPADPRDTSQTGQEGEQ